MTTRLLAALLLLVRLPLWRGKHPHTVQAKSTILETSKP